MSYDNILIVFEDLRLGIIDEKQAADELFQMWYRNTWEYKIKEFLKGTKR